MKYEYFISYSVQTKQKSYFSSIGRTLDHKIETVDDVLKLTWQISEENSIDRSKDNLLILGITLLKETDENE